MLSRLWFDLGEQMVFEFNLKKLIEGNNIVDDNGRLELVIRALGYLKEIEQV